MRLKLILSKVYGPDMHVSGIVPLALLGKKSEIPEFQG
jgi:ATP citrate (pro-S)-lyase